MISQEGKLHGRDKVGSKITVDDRRSTRVSSKAICLIKNCLPQTDQQLGLAPLSVTLPLQTRQMVFDKAIAQLSVAGVHEKKVITGLIMSRQAKKVNTHLIGLLN